MKTHSMLLGFALFNLFVGGRGFNNPKNSSDDEYGQSVKNNSIFMDTESLPTTTDSGRCSFNHRLTDWETALRSCETENKELLCYKSKSQIEEIIQNLGLANYDYLDFWMYNLDCNRNRMEECARLRIERSEKKIEHDLRSNCDRQDTKGFPSICCVPGTGRCSYNHRLTDWATAVRTCETENKQLLCYESKSQIEDITENLGLANYRSLDLWMYNRDCSSNQMEECTSLHIYKTEEKIQHHRIGGCVEGDTGYPSVCCVNGAGATGSPTKWTQRTEWTRSPFRPTPAVCDGDEMEVCERKRAKCAADSTTDSGFRCICEVGYFGEDGICTDGDEFKRIGIPILVAIVILLILLICGVFCMFKMNRKSTHA